MKLRIAALLCFVLSASAVAKETVTYPVAHVRQGEVSTVMVVISPNFFNSDASSQAGWYKAVVACVRSAKLAGDIFVVANFNQRFNYYGPKGRAAAVQGRDMKWVNARVNRQLTCTY